LAGRPMKTGWANQVSTSAGVEIVTSDEFPADASVRTQRAYQVLAQLTIGVPVTSIGQMLTTAAASSSFSTTNTTPATTAAYAPAFPQSYPSGGVGSRVPTVADARASLAAAAASGHLSMSLPVAAPAVATASTAVVPDPTKIGGAEHPTKTVLVHNMYNKDEETEPGWEKEIRDEFEEECSKFGKIQSVTVMSQEPGGKIYASFDSIEGAKSCASSLAGRWFDKRQLRVEFVADDDVPTKE
jgi:RNA-binding protein 23/39